MRIFLLPFLLFLSSEALAEFKFGLNVGYSPNYTLRSNALVNVNGTIAITEVELDFASSAEFGLDFWDTSRNSWGLISGVSTTPDRRSKSMKVLGQSQAVDTLKIASTFIYVGAHYRWESFYIPFGLTCEQIHTLSNFYR